MILAQGGHVGFRLTFTPSAILVLLFLWSWTNIISFLNLKKLNIIFIFIISFLVYLNNQFLIINTIKSEEKKLI